MELRTSTAVAGATVAAFVCVSLANSLSKAFAHAVAGARIFPATLAIDDPGVGDELALPTLTYFSSNADDAREVDFSFNYAKRITENIALSIGDSWTSLKPGGSGWGNLDTGVKWNFFVDGSHEFMASVGLDATWAKTGAGNFSNPFTTLTPSLYFGKGFGDLPTSVNVLRPFAITGQLGVSLPAQQRNNTITYDDSGAAYFNSQQNPTIFNWGFTLQYSLPYSNANVGEIAGPDFIKRLIPIVEIGLQSPFSNAPAGARNTTGHVQPGIIYEADSWQIAIEALIPVNKASGKRLGVIAELHFFFDDIFPNSLGKPLL